MAYNICLVKSRLEYTVHHMNLELCELLHELLLLFAVAERRQDVKEDLEQLEVLP